MTIHNRDRQLELERCSQTSKNWFQSGFQFISHCHTDLARLRSKVSCICFDYINGFLWLDQGISRRQKGEQEGKWKTRSRPPTQRRAWGCDRLNHQVLLLFTLLLWTAGKTMRFRCNSKSRINTKMSLRNDILRSIGCIPSGVLMLVLTLALIGCNHQVIIEEHG